MHGANLKIPSANLGARSDVLGESLLKKFCEKDQNRCNLSRQHFINYSWAVIMGASEAQCKLELSLTTL